MPLSTEELRKHWGAQIRRTREDLKLSRSAVAAKVGVQPETIYRIERGLMGSDATRLAIAEALEADPSVLYAYPTATEEAAS